MANEWHGRSTWVVSKSLSANLVPSELADMTADGRITVLLSRYGSTPGHRIVLGLHLVRCMEEDPGRPDSVPVLRRLLADFGEAVGPESLPRLEVARVLGAALAAHGLDDDAERTYRDALRAASVETGRQSDVGNRVREGLFLFLARRDRLDEALALHRQVEVEGDEVLVHRGRLARMLATAGHPHEAVAEYGVALREAETTLGPDHVRTINLRTLLAALAADHDHPIAEEAQRGVVADLERVQGADSPGALAARCDLAHLVGRLGRPDESAALFRELAEDHRRALGPAHPGTLVTTAELGRLLLDLGRDREAVRLFRKLLPVAERVLGDHPVTHDARTAALHR